MNQIEIACFNVKSARIAQENEASRVELCDNLSLGGTTPTLNDIVEAREFLTIDLYIMIRPRGGNFIYAAEEFNQMKNDILSVKNLNVNGFVFGILNEDNSINIHQNKELVNLAYPAPCTFHRAFDKVPDRNKALEDVINCGFKTILTSGLANNVNAGIDNLKLLVEKAKNRIVIMPGGGLRSTNIRKVKEFTNAIYFHSSAITDESGIANPDEIKLLKIS